MFYSPLRYPGGKGILATFMKSAILENDLLDGTYVEPYAGGAGTALALLFEEFVHNIIINDLDRSLYAFWYSVLNFTEDLCKLINDTEVTIKEWQRQREVQTNKERAGLLELGYSTFFLNRTNRSGIINAGVIGGKEQKGSWKMDVRFNKTDLIRRIKKVAYYKSRISLYNLDAVELINQVIPTLPQRSLIYFDPPYYIKGKKLYVNFYSDKDHIDLYNAVTKNVPQKWVLTYDNADEILKLYQLYRPQSYKLNYSVGSIKSKGTEMMYFSSNFIIPKNIDILVKIDNNECS